MEAITSSEGLFWNNGKKVNETEAIASSSEGLFWE